MLKLLCGIVMISIMMFSGSSAFLPAKANGSERIKPPKEIAAVAETSPTQQVPYQEKLAARHPKSTPPSENELYCSVNKAIVATNIVQHKVKPNEVFSVHFTVDESLSIKGFDCKTVGFHVTAPPKSIGNQILVRLSTDLATVQPVFTLHITLQDGKSVEPQVFGCVNAYGVYLSESSYDGAWSYSLEDLKAQGAVSDEEAEQMQVDHNKQYIEEEIHTEEHSGRIAPRYFGQIPGNTRVRGRLQWRDDKGVLHPLQFTQVVVIDKDAVVDDTLGECFTDANGDYVCGFNNQEVFTEQGGCDPYIRVLAVGIGYNVAVSRKAYNRNETYMAQSGVTENVATYSTTYINMTFTMDNDLGRAFQILQAAVTTFRYVAAMDSTHKDLGRVTIQYPHKGDDCFYRSNEIYITASAAIDGMPQSYASWDVIAHEYGHHLQRLFDVTDSPGGEHGNINMADNYRNDNIYPVDQCKEKGMKLAWGESWNTVLGIRAQQYYSSILQNINTVADSSCTAYNGVDFDLETLQSWELEGEACETTVCGVLYDMCDPSNEAYDSVDMGDNNFFNTTAASKAKTLSEFINYCIGNNKVDPIALGGILSRHNIAPGSFRATLGITTAPPSFSWYVGNGYSYSHYQNNKFQIVFYDSNGNEICRTNETYSTTYTLTQSEWDKVLTSSGTTFKAAVIGYQTSSPTTGGYLSSAVEYTKPVPAPLLETINVSSIGSTSRYVEKVASLQPGQCIDYQVTFETSGFRKFQTFGPKDAYLYLYDGQGTLLVSDDDSGYGLNAFISYHMSANTVYKVRMKFYSSSVGGEVVNNNL